MKANWILSTLLVVLSLNLRAQYDNFNPNNNATQATKSVIENQSGEDEPNASEKHKKVVFGCTGTVGYTGMVSRFTGVPIRQGLGVGGDLGLDARYTTNDRRFWSVGTRISTSGTTYTMTGSIDYQHSMDPINGHYTLTSSFDMLQECQRWIALGIPIAIYWRPAYRNLTLGFGIEPSALIWNRFRLVSGTYQTEYYSEDLDVTIPSTLDNHGVTSQSIMSKGYGKTMDCRMFSVIPFVDITYNYGEWALGCYIGYDIVNACRNQQYNDAQLVEIVNDELRYNGLITSGNTISTHKFSVGIRVRRCLGDLKFTEKHYGTSINNEIERETDTVYMDRPFYDTNCVNLIKLLLGNRYSQRSADRAIRQFDSIANQEYRMANIEYREALSNCQAVFEEYQGIVSTIQNELGKLFGTDDVSRWKSMLENTGYWRRRSGINPSCRYSSLEYQVNAMVALLDEMMRERTKLTLSDFRDNFRQLANYFKN